MSQICRNSRSLIALLGGLLLALNAVAQKPTIAKVDPPDWFVSLPDPMLLVHGTGLHDAVFTVAGKGVRVVKTQSSENGHWAMVWLNTRAAGAGTLHVTAKNNDGAAEFEYRLSARRAESDGMAGVSSKDVMMCIMPDRFADGDTKNNVPAGSPGSYDRTKPRAYHGGDLRGVIDHLDYLQQLGVTAVWLTPVIENAPESTDYHGYGATDMYAIDPHLGTVSEYRELSDALHKRHMKLVFDDVPNHVGQKNVWVHDPPMPDWFHGSEAKHVESQGSFDAITDMHAPQRSSNDALNGWFVNILPDMNQQNPAVAQYLTENMMWWVEKAGIDGLRIDTFPYVQRTFWQEYLLALTRVYPKLTEVGEVSGGDPTINAFFAGGRTLLGADTHLTTPFDYPMYYTLREVLLKGKPMSHLEDTLRQDWLYPHPEALVTFIGNHDQPRFLNEPGASPALLQIATGLVMTMRGTPQLYAGDEVNMVGGEDPDNRRDFPGGFPGDTHNAFTAAGRTTAENEMHGWVAALGKLRAGSAALQTGVMQTVLSDESGFGFVRTLDAKGKACTAGAAAMLVVMNRGMVAREVAIPVSGTGLEGCRSASGKLGATGETAIGTEVKVKLPANGFAVYELR